MAVQQHLTHVSGWRALDPHTVTMLVFLSKGISSGDAEEKHLLSSWHGWQDAWFPTSNVLSIHHRRVWGYRKWHYYIFMEVNTNRKKNHMRHLSQEQWMSHVSHSRIPGVSLNRRTKSYMYRWHKSRGKGTSVQEGTDSGMRGICSESIRYLYEDDPMLKMKTKQQQKETLCLVFHTMQRVNLF